MNTKTNTLIPIQVTSAEALRNAILDGMERETTTRFLIYSEWSETNPYFSRRLDEMRQNTGVDCLYTVDIFDIPNALNILRASILEEIDGGFFDLKAWRSLPMLVVLHKGCYPQVIGYNGSIVNELGL